MVTKDKLCDTKKHGDLIKWINEIFEKTKEDESYKELQLEWKAEKEINRKIQVFDVSKENLKPSKESEYKIAEADILITSNNEPLFIIEPETGGSPKTFGRSIPVYTVAEHIKIKTDREYPIEKPIILIIVIPNQPEDGKKAEQLKILNTKLKKTIALSSHTKESYGVGREFLKDSNSKLLDFAFCQCEDFERVFKEMLKNHAKVWKKLYV